MANRNKIRDSIGERAPEDLGYVVRTSAGLLNGESNSSDGFHTEYERVRRHVS